jgi:uncharacterized protein (TIGR03066 family)
MSRKRKQKKLVESARQNPAPVLRRGWLKWLITLLVLLTLTGGGIALYQYLTPARIPPEMVGTWQVSGGDFNNAKIEFYRNGKMTAIVPQEDGYERMIEAWVEVEGNLLKNRVTDPRTNKTVTGAQTILTMTEAEIVTVDPNGVKIHMKRVP